MNVTGSRDPRVDASRVRDAVLSIKRVKGMTHGIYRYPARFSPEFVRACLEGFSKPDDLVLDPFVGGGTTAVEALAQGRRFVGFDLNPLSTLLTQVKTTPLSKRDKVALREWVERAFDQAPVSDAIDPRLRNAPGDLVAELSGPRASIESLASPRQQAAARAVLLATGQWAMDGRHVPVTPDKIKPAAIGWLASLLEGMDEFVGAVQNAGHRPSAIAARRVLRTGSAATIAGQRGLNRLAGRVGLVVTSPPYPGVHVLYHRWQVRGRRETPFPYWLADAQDGLGPKHYTMGGRTEIGVTSYFDEMRTTWSSIARLLRRDAAVIQLVAFAHSEARLEAYLEMMSLAGFERMELGEADTWRAVPNRRWYNRVDPKRGLGREVLLAHRVSR